ncbi:HAMP domain-containing histidine kinase [Pyxidicoccus parkwayensis]|uniref:histidine kinase n=1 Tax=Pyxidicoccus parkwayensis TaxID=2813578 RepID=A0ABX7NT14_9BACT|nr:HAMP domain-containing sensor histidine kinase [Pyxidicoccus parkwaysis]QSQ22002.1 HAMP domain-containing histidine kinase [Pyxidicoccus parkwaysis]
MVGPQSTPGGCPPRGRGGGRRAIRDLSPGRVARVTRDVHLHCVSDETSPQSQGERRDRLLQALESLLALPAAELRPTMDKATLLISELLKADKVDVFFLDTSTQTLVAVGTSDTPMGRKQRALGLDRLPLANGGRSVQVYESDQPFMSNRQHEDPEELPGIKHRLGVKSSLMVPLPIGGETRGVLGVCSAQPDFFIPDDLRFLVAVARWVGAVAHRVELVQELTKLATRGARRAAAEELVTVLAHDMANHLMPLRARIELIQRRARRDNAADYLRDAEGAATSLKALSRLIGDLLDVSRLDQGLFTMRPQPVDVVALAKEVAATMRSPGRAVEYRGPDELVVIADPDRLRQILENLTANALKHSPPGLPVGVDVQWQVRPEGRWARITVSNQGPGIAPEVMDTLFERFARGPGSTGLGLGLYLSRRIALAHGGTLEVTSTPGAGTRFEVALPEAPSPVTE